VLFVIKLEYKQKLYFFEMGQKRGRKNKKKERYHMRQKMWICEEMRYYRIE
jgi:hypothetical protein